MTLDPWTLLHDNDFSWDDVNAIAAVLDHHDLDIRPRADGPNGPDGGGHRTHVEHDCFLMNCHDLGEEVTRLQDEVIALRDAYRECLADSGRDGSPAYLRVNRRTYLPAGYEPEDAPAFALAVDALKRAIAEDEQ